MTRVWYHGVARIWAEGGVLGEGPAWDQRGPATARAHRAVRNVIAFCFISNETLSSGKTLHPVLSFYYNRKNVAGTLSWGVRRKR
jgi:hypothetical protein